MGDWDDDPQRAAYENAVGDYILFAQIVHRWDETGYSPHDDIDYEPGNLDDWDGCEVDAQGNPVIVLFIPADSIEPCDEYGDDRPWLFFDDYDEHDHFRPRCKKHNPKDNPDARS